MRSVVVDMRCFQDADYAERGVGRLGLALLRYAPRDLRLFGLMDPAMSAALPAAAACVASASFNAYAAACPGPGATAADCFVSLSPMTHDPLFAARLLADVRLLRAAVVYDFIPRRFPDRYLATPGRRLDYAIALRWLARNDVFAPISRATADDLTSILGVDRAAMAVIGAPIDPGFEQGARTDPRRHVLVVGGPDRRKNPEVAIRAHAQSPAMQRGAGIPLIIAGNYSPADARAFQAIARDAGGRSALVQVPGYLAEAALVELFAHALMLVSPSVDEGFSIPVAEGMAAGAPCLVSDIPAHVELVSDPEWRFAPDDAAALCAKMERVLADAAWCAAAEARQAALWPRFRAEAVAGRFWDAVTSRLGRAPVQAPRILRGYRPRVAILSPVPPDRSGVADYTAATCAAFGTLVDLHVFTEIEGPTPMQNVATVRPLGALPHLMPQFDRVISVVGNSHFHTRIFEMLHRYGSACIAHDARMLGFYRILLGEDRALAVAARELGRPVEAAELNGWLAEESTMKALFLGEIAQSAAPMIVHSVITARLCAERYGVEPATLPFCIYRPWTREALTAANRAHARTRLGLPDGEVVIASFGIVHSNKGAAECIWALELLRGWGVRVSLHFVGGLADDAGASDLRRLVAALGLTGAVHFVSDFISEERYRDYLAGADLAVQLRTYGLGALSGAVLDCAAAGLPTVTNRALGEAVDVPDYVRCIPDALSPVLLAEALAGLLDEGLAAQRPETARAKFAADRSFGRYADLLLASLCLDQPVRDASALREAS